VNYREKIIIVLLSVSISLSCLFASGQNPQPVNTRAGIPADSTEAIILNIRKEYIRIKTDSAKYRVVHQDVMDESTEGGEIVRYLDGKQMVELVATFYGETGKNVTEYYFSGTKLFFCYQRHTIYTRPMSGVALKVEENRYYLDNLQMVRWLKSNGKIVDKTLYFAKRKELMEELTHLLSLKAETP
jgi:hypothetical protein